jgi:hypothetical protein
MGALSGDDEDILSARLHSHAHRLGGTAGEAGNGQGTGQGGRILGTQGLHEGEEDPPQFGQRGSRDSGSHRILLASRATHSSVLGKE